MAARKNDEEILAALLSSQTVKDAAKKCGISPRTIYKRLAVPEFRERYEAGKRELLDDSITALQSYLQAAINTMGEIVADKKANKQTRLNAADAIIRNMLKLSERADVLERLDALERALK